MLHLAAPTLEYTNMTLDKNVKYKITSSHLFECLCFGNLYYMAVELWSQINEFFKKYLIY